MPSATPFAILGNRIPLVGMVALLYALAPQSVGGGVVRKIADD